MSLSIIWIHRLRFANNVILFLLGRVFSNSAAIRDDLWSRDDHHPADDVGDGQISRDAQQRARVHEAERGAARLVRTSHGLRRLHLGHDQRPRYVHGKCHVILDFSSMHLPHSTRNTTVHYFYLVIYIPRPLHPELLND